MITKRRSKIKLDNVILFCMVLVSSMVVLQLFRKEFFLLFQVLFCAVFFVFRKKIVLLKYPVINLIFFTLFINAVSARFTDMPASYKKTAIDLAIMAVPLYLAVACIVSMWRQNDKVLVTVIKAFKVMVLIQAFWIPVQFVLYKGMHIDINKLLFVQTFHMVDNATFIRSWVYHPSGLSWHSAILAPVFVLGFMLFKNIFVRLLLLGDSLICGNSTTLIGVVACAALLFGCNVIDKKIKITKKQVVGCAIIALAFVGILVMTPLGETVLKTLINLYNRLFGSEVDASTSAHFGYYADYFTIIGKSSWMQVLFGYGYGCSGYTITKLYGRYAGMKSWAIESDYVNIALSRGIVGFLLYYYFLLWILVKGVKLDKRYGVFMAVILLQGFGYNIQFDHLFFIELIMYICIKNKVNFFEYNERSKLPIFG